MTEFPSPEEILPHRPPFLFLDEIIELRPAEYAKARWTLTGDEWWFPGHFPGRPTLPGVLMCEAIAQMGAYTVLTDPERYPGKLPLFGGLDKARFRRQVGPGDTVEVEADILQLSARAGKGKGAVYLDGKVACSADIMFVVVDG
ncbi:MAG: 3-hydroxyacyl-ACP dehydratase FabZ [Acidimicrobiales bacterium]|nr:3-hydroxyacyl-ACP dehydratase FabZ [Acidimicrobiales bacterium]